MQVKLASLILLAATVAHADSVTPPVGWGLDKDAAFSLAKGAFDVPHFGQHGIATAKVFHAPAPNKVTLFVTRVEANVAAEGRDAAATAELDEIHGAMRRANAKAESSSQKADAATKQLEAGITWRDASTGVATMNRVVIAGDAQRLVGVLGECVMPVDANATIVAECKAALATLDPDVPVASRVPLAIVAAAPPPPAKAGSDTDGPRLTQSGPRPTMAPMTIPIQRETDRRPIYIGGGLVVLAIVFYFNRRRREKFERDEDADDLHDAAEDEKDDR